MKTLRTLIAIATLSFFATTATSQAIFVNDANLFGNEEVELTTFAVADMDMKASSKGFKVEFEAYNQTNVVRYEIQLSEDNTNFSTVKRVNSEATVESKYQVEFNNTIILADVVYYRVKTVFANGSSVFTNSYKVKIKK